MLVGNYGLIAVEDLNCRGLAGSMLAKSVHDAGWSQFISILCVKAEWASRTVVKVNPAGTIQDYSRCGHYVPKLLKDRWHLCAACGLSMSRDRNAAVNVLNRALALIAARARMEPSGDNGGPLLFGAKSSRRLRSRQLMLAESSLS